MFFAFLLVSHTIQTYNTSNLVRKIIINKTVEENKKIALNFNFSLNCHQVNQSFAKFEVLGLFSLPVSSDTLGFLMSKTQPTTAKATR